MIGSKKYILSKEAHDYYDIISGLIDKTRYTHLTNPCLTKDTWILTSNGPRQISELIGKEFVAIVNGERYKASGFWLTGSKPIYKIQTDRGYSIKATENHKFYLENKRKPKFGGGYVIDNVWKELKELKIQDKLVLNNQRGFSWDGYGDLELGWLLGEIVGDGGHNEENGNTYLRFWGTSQFELSSLAKEIVEYNFKVRSDFGEEGFSRINRCSQVKCKALGEFAAKFIDSKTKNLLPALENTTSSLFIKGFIRGFFDADGTVACNSKKGSSIRLSQNDLEKLYIVQRMLGRFGIVSTVYTNRRIAGNRLMPDSDKNLKEYYCQAQHELVISKDNINQFYDQIGFNEPDKQIALENIIDNQKEIYKERFLTKVQSIELVGEEEVYDCTVEAVHSFDANCFMSHNCGEITLHARGGYCLIGDLVPFFADTLEEVKESARLAARFLVRTNLMDSIYSDEVSRTNRIGVSMTGIHEFAWKFFGLGFRDLINEQKSIRFWKFIGELRSTVEISADNYSDQLNVNHPHTYTTIKPSGSVSKLFALTEGAHLPAHKYYLRWVMFSTLTGEADKYKDQGYPVVPLVSYPNTVIVGFPTIPMITTLGMGDKLVTASEATPEEQYQWLMLLEKYWLGEGNNNQVSYTMKFKQDNVSLEDFRSTLLKFQSQIRCCSVMPEKGIDFLRSQYEYLPEEEVSQEEFDSIVNHIKKKMESVISMEELQCSSGLCPM